MNLSLDTIATVAKRIGIQAEDLAAVTSQGAAVSYAAGDYLFHESTPREWMGVVLEGDVDISRGAQGRATTLATLKPGAFFSEGVMLDESPHSASAVTRQGAKVWQIKRDALEKVRSEKPDVFYRIVGRVAARLSERLRMAAERIAGERSATTVAYVRAEHDSIGERELPEDAYYGVQTIRGVENFQI